MLTDVEQLKIGVVGGGRRCKALLTAIFGEPDPDRRPQILAVADTDPQAVGLQFAQSKGIFTTSDYNDLCSIEELELILELTPDDDLRAKIQKIKPPGVLFMDHHQARAVLDNLQIKAKKYEILNQILQNMPPDSNVEPLIDDFHSFVADINRQAHTYARENRESLIRSEWNLSQIINGSTIATFVIDKQHRVTHWNLACERLTGHSAQTMVGTDQQWKPFRSQKRPTMADLILEGVDETKLWTLYSTHWEKSALIDGGYEAEEYFPHLGEDGLWLFFTGAPIKAPDGSLVGAIETLQDHTRQKQIEAERENQNRELAEKVEQLVANERMVAQIIDGSTIPTFVIDKTHQVTHWNHALEKLTGHAAADMVGTRNQWAPFYERQRPSMADVILDQTDESQIRRLYGTNWRPSALIANAYEAKVFFPNLGAGGKWCWFTAAPIKTPEGDVVGAIETIWDITEERKAEHDREQHTRELATFCSIYATLSSSLNLDGRIRAAVEEMVNIFLLAGVCIFIIGKDNNYHLRYSNGHSDSLCYKNRTADGQSMIAQVARSGRPVVYNCLPESNNDHEIQLVEQEGLHSIAYIPILDKDKQTLGVLRAASTAVDHFGPDEIRAIELITNRIGVTIENALLQDEIKRRVDFQARLINSSNNGIVATDDSGKIVIFNPAAELIFGYRRADLVGQVEAQTIFPGHISADFQAARNNGVNQLPWRETEIVAKTGEAIPVRFSGSLLREKHRIMGNVAFFQDLREIKRLERELVNAERLAAIGQTVAGMAHCVKNILHGLRGGSYMVNLGIDKDKPDKLKSGWQMVQRNIQRTSDLVQDLLSYSKEREPEFAPCRPNDLVAEICELMQEVAHENEVELIQRLDPAMGSVNLDERSLHRCLLNLVSNAIDACRDDDNIGKQHQVVVVSRREEDKWAIFEVQDNGSGMSDEVKARLFSSFFSTKGPQGTGLGLLVTHKLIEEHQGAIEVSSELNQGTTFQIRLPIQQSDRENSRMAD